MDLTIKEGVRRWKKWRNFLHFRHQNIGVSHFGAGTVNWKKRNCLDKLKYFMKWEWAVIFVIPESAWKQNIVVKNGLT